MKTLIAFVLMLCTTPIMAQTITFAWDPHPEAAQIAGFKLYQSKNSMTYGSTPVATFTGGTLTTGSIPKPGPGKYFWVLTAFTPDTLESDYSNEVSLSVKPKPPKLNTVQQVAGAIKHAASQVASLFQGHKNLRIAP